MISLAKTVFVIGIFLIQLSTSAVLERHRGRHHRYHHHGTSSSIATPSTNVSEPTATLSTVLSTNEAPIPTFVPTVTETDDSETSDESDESDDSADTEPAASVDSPTTLKTATVVPVPATSPVAVATQVPAVTASATAAPASTQPAGTFWEPAAGATWQIELSGIVSDTSYPADVFDLDLFDVPQATIDALHAAGKKVICYFSAGSFENWRPDQASFQAADKGTAMEGWEGEWWLNTKTANVRSIMSKRIDLAKSKGCDGVDPDNVDGYGNNNGVGLTAADGADFMNFLADDAHSKGLSIGLKNAGDLVDSVLAKMQWHVNEQCLEFDECDTLIPFIAAGKPVFHIEYPETAPTISAAVKSEKCVAATANNFSTVLKNTALDAWVETC